MGREELDLVPLRQRQTDSRVNGILGAFGAAALLGSGGQEHFEVLQRELAHAIVVEQLKAVRGGSPEFVQRDQTVEIGIGPGNRLREVEQAVSGRTLKAVELISVDIVIPLPPVATICSRLLPGAFPL